VYPTGLILDQNLDHAIDAIEEGFSTIQFSNEVIQTGDSIYMIIQDDLLIEPKVNEYFTVEGIKKRIVDIEKDLMNVNWFLLCRR